ncbi:hypothetical protein ElyMa_001250700 [Elysia marginata]|uniref:C-type lectin domain-containing protein n=1 Tax=Elysia marginata TaxID=1093978 RepID=A0AAV4IB33_9GAST|nr:hypothetical protein ElyMa_001250700 [Elysia marginata]
MCAPSTAQSQHILSIYLIVPSRAQETVYNFAGELLLTGRPTLGNTHLIQISLVYANHISSLRQSEMQPTQDLSTSSSICPPSDTTDYADDCHDLYDNLIVREGTFKMITATWHTNFTAMCGLEDFSMWNCQAGFMSKSNMCLRFLRLETHSIAGAASACRDLNSRLASLLTLADIDAVLDITMNISSFRTVKLWAIGHYSPLNNGYYVDSFGYLIPSSSDIFTGVTLGE